MEKETVRAVVDELVERVSAADSENGNGQPSLSETGAVGATIFGGQIIDGFEKVSDFLGSARWQTIRSMIFGDAKVWGSLQARILPLRQAQWSLTPDPDVDEISAFCWSVMHGMRRPWKDVVYDFTMSPRWGFVPMEIVWANREGRWVWDDLALRLPWTIPEDGWEFDAKGRFVGLRQTYTDARTGEQVDTPTIPAEKLLIFTHEQVGNDYRGNPLVRFMWKNYRMKGGLEKIDAVANERNAMGVPSWRLPRMPAVGDEDAAEKIVENVRTHEKGGVVVPFGHDFRVEGVQGTVRETVPSIRYHGEEISLTTLANFLDLGKTSSGSRALADPQLDLFQLVLMDAARYDAERINRALRQLVVYNFGPQDTYPEARATLLTNRRLDVWTSSMMTGKEKGGFGPWGKADVEWFRKEAGAPNLDPALWAEHEEEERRRKEAARQVPEDGPGEDGPTGDQDGDRDEGESRDDNENG